MIIHRRRFLAQSGLALASAVVGSSSMPGLLRAANSAAEALRDHRLEPLKDLNGYFPFTPPATRAEWEQRAEALRWRLRVALGLWPMPARIALQPVIHGGVERENYRVEKVFFESLPGFYVTGSLYRPLQAAGRVPGVLFAHGHWKDGRFMETSEDEVRREIAQGAERFEEGGRSIMQSLCVGLARLGCVVFHYDMIGYADSQQITTELAHGFRTQRPEMNADEGWGLFSPQAEAHLQSIMGLQTWNSMRSLDFLLSLPEVDPERVACTGASGGGTQTFILSALDSRVKLAFPAVMVSTAMQGGCTCENASLLRVGTGNVEIAALIAPRPLGMTTANDWTKEMSAKGFPELKKLYTLLGAPDRVALFRGEHFEHNYNAVSRAAFYGWLNRHFGLGQKDPILERDYRRLTRQELSVWDAQHPAPAAGPDFERRLLRGLTDDANRQLQEAAREPVRFREVYAPAIGIVLGRTLADAGQVAWTTIEERTRAGWTEIRGRTRNTTHQEDIPVVLFRPVSWNGRVVLWLNETGKAGLYDADQPLASVRRILDRGLAVCGADLLFQGDFLENGAPLTRTRRVKETRESAAYTFGYNHALFAQRVHDVLTVLQHFLSDAKFSKRVALLALDRGSGPLAAASLAVAGPGIESAAFNTHGFRFGQVRDLHDLRFLPGGAKYGDLPGMIALSQAKTLWMAGEPASTADLVNRLGSSRTTRFDETAGDAEKGAVDWLLNA
ncbi:MAG TPA: acetylxylan esterase [Verrucomicrobiota bacterium]|nr:acetylxylan esterase [Verrucomicrobiota bacterium]